MNPPTLREPIIVREAGWVTIICVLTATFGLITTIAFPAVISMLASLGDGVVNIIMFSAIFIVAIGGVACAFGGLRLGDVGLRSSKFFEAVVVVVSVWLIIQAAHVIVALISRGSVHWDDAWTRFGATDRLLWLVIMMAGVALTEETVFRGFVFPQLHLKTPGSQRTRFWVAAIGAALLFGLLHVPRHLILANMTGVALTARVLAHALGGLIATTLYLRTRNLWIVIGLHGIDNAPTRLVESPMPSEPVLLLMEIALLVAWPWLTRRPHQRGLAPIISR